MKIILNQAWSIKMAISGSVDGTVKVFNLSSSQTLFTLAHVAPINSIKVLDQYNLACASNENAIKIWNLQTGQLFGSLLHNNVVLILEIFDRFMLASGSRDQTAVFWNWPTLTKLKTFHHSEDVSALLKVNDTVLATGGKTVKLWDINTGSLILTIVGDNSLSVMKIINIPNQRLVSISSRSRQAKVWSAENGQWIANLEVNNPDGSYISVVTLIQIDNISIAIGTEGSHERIVIWSTIKKNCEIPSL